MRETIKALGIDRWKTRFISAHEVELFRGNYFLTVKFIPDSLNVNISVRNVVTRETMQCANVQRDRVRVILEPLNARILIEEAHLF